MESALITGATGLVGCGLVRLLLSRGLHVTAFVRGSSDDAARDRMIAALEEQCAIDSVAASAEMLERLTVFNADITNRESLMDRLPELSDIDTVYHSAACVNFIDVLQCQDVNVEGTRNVLEFTRHLAPQRFNHISTAFVAGGFAGEIQEDTMPPRETLNAYEDTKYEAELLVRGQQDVPFTVLRPSIIVGNAKDGKIRSFKNFYLIVRYFARLAKKKNRPPLRFPGLGDGRINLVPLDFVVEATARIGMMPSTRRTYHLVNDEPPTTHAIVRSIEDAVGRRCVEFLGEQPEFNDEELATQTRFQEFMPYFFGSPTFELTSMHEVIGSMEPSRLGDDALRRVASYYVAQEIKS